MYSHEKEVLVRIAGQLKKVYQERIVAIYAFGSRVRGDYTEESDFDVLVVVKDSSGNGVPSPNGGFILLCG